MLNFTNYQKSYNTTTVIAIPKLTLTEGIYWLQGENGAGKTTVLKFIAGLIPFLGSITIHDIEIRKYRKQYRQLVNWADADPLYPDFLTGLDLIDLYQQTVGTSNTELQYLLKAFSVDKYVKRKVSTYSSGMTKKLSLVLAFMGSPQWILLDEPLITLDVAAVQTCISLIQEYNKKGISFLITSHQSFIETATFPVELLYVRNKTIEVI